MRRWRGFWSGVGLGLAVLAMVMVGCQPAPSAKPETPSVTLAPEAPAVKQVETPALAELAGEYELDLTAEEREAFGGESKVPRLVIRADGTYVLVLPNEDKRLEGKTQWSKGRLVLSAGPAPSEEDVILLAQSDGSLKEDGAEGLAFRRRGTAAPEADPAAFGEAPTPESTATEEKEGGQ